MADKNTKFWLALLKFGENEEQRKRNWNVYCTWMFKTLFDQLIPSAYNMHLKNEINNTGFDNEETSTLADLVNKFGGHPDLEESIRACTPFMNFAYEKFDDAVSFSGRILIAADFSKAVFTKSADFKGSDFLGSTHFSEAELRGEASFSDSLFYKTVDFSSVQFPCVTTFDNTTFHGPAKFREGEIHVSIRRRLHSE